MQVLIYGKKLGNDDAILTYTLKDINYIYNQEIKQYSVEITFIKDYNVVTDTTDYVETMYNQKNIPSYQDIINFFLESVQKDFNIYQKNPQLFKEKIKFLESIDN